MSEAARDTRLSLQARAIAFWIYENPSEAINPDAIAQANQMTVGYVRKLLAELASYGYLVAPQKYQAEKGRFAYTPYTLPPQAKITATVDEPSRSDNQHGHKTVTVESVDGAEYTPTHMSDAATCEKDLSKSSPVLSEKQKTEQDLVAQHDQIAPPVDDFEADLQTRSPEQQTNVRALIANAQPPDDGYQDTPPPGVPLEPPAPDIVAAEAYWREQLPKVVLSPGYKIRLRKAVKRYGLLAAKEVIDLAKEREAYAPMRYIEVTLEGQEQEGKLPRPEPVDLSHSQAADEPDDGQPVISKFAPPPPNWKRYDNRKGVPA